MLDFDYNHCRQQDNNSEMGENDYLNLFNNIEKLNDLLESDHAEKDGDISERLDNLSHVEDVEYMNQLMDDSGNVEEDGGFISELLDNIENNTEKDCDISELLDNENAQQGEKRDLSSPMSTDSGIGLGIDSGVFTNPISQQSQNSSSGKGLISSDPSVLYSNPPALTSRSPVLGSSSLVLNPNRPVAGSNLPVFSSNHPVPSSNPSLLSSNIPISDLTTLVPSLNPLVTVSNDCVPSWNPPVSGSNPPTAWRVEIIYDKQSKNVYKDRERAYWRKRKLEDKNQRMKRKKVAWSYEKAPRSFKAECALSHYSYKEEDDFDDLYMIADMLGVNPGDASDTSHDSDTSDDESDEEDEVESADHLESHEENINVEDPWPSNILDDTTNHQPDGDKNWPGVPQHCHDDPSLFESLVMFPPHRDTNQSVEPYIPDYINTRSASPSPDYANQCDASCTSSNQLKFPNISVGPACPNLICDPTISSNTNYELPLAKKSRPFSRQSYSSKVIISEFEEATKKDYEREETVIDKDMPLRVTEKTEKKCLRSSCRMVLKCKTATDDKDELVEKPELFDHPRILTKRSRNRDRKVKLYEKGKMANEKEEEKRLRALRTKLNRDRIKFERIRMEERIKELEKENATLQEEVEDRKLREDEGKRRTTELEDALMDSRKREEELQKLLVDAMKREKEMLNEIKERKREAGLREEVGRENSGLGKEAEKPQGLWTVAHPRSTVTGLVAIRLPLNTIRLVLIGLILNWIVRRRYWFHR